MGVWADMSWSTTSTRMVATSLAPLVLVVACESCAHSEGGVAAQEPRGNEAPGPSSPSGQHEAPPEPSPSTGSAESSSDSTRSGSESTKDPEPSGSLRKHIGDVEDLGELPAGLSIRWPTAPRVQREVEVRTSIELERAAAQAGTRVRVKAPIGGRVVVKASDVEIVQDEGARIEHLFLARSQARIAIKGGRYGWIEFQVPRKFAPPPEEPRPAWTLEDVLIDGVTVDSPNTAFLVRARRLAIVNSRAKAPRYAVWCGDTREFQSEDVIIANNVFQSEGREATVRLVDVKRSVVVDNVLRNGLKHNYRVHGTSELNFAARNVLVDTGVMIGTMPGDQVSQQWFVDNTFFHTAPDMFNIDREAVTRMVAKRNVAYTDVWDAFYKPAPAPSWDFDENRRQPHRPPPSAVREALDR